MTAAARVRRRGLTLPEVLVAMALFGMVSTAIALLLNAALSYTRRAETRAELQRAALFALNGVAREIAESSSDSLRVGSGGGEPVGLVFGSPRGADDQVEYQNNRLLWKSWIAVYWDQPQGLLMRSRRLLDTPSPFKPDPSPQGLDVGTALMAGMPPANQRVLTRRVSDLVIEAGREVKLTLQVEVAEEGTVSRLTTQTAVRPNH